MPVVNKELILLINMSDQSGNGTLSRTTKIYPRIEDHQIGDITPHWKMIPTGINCIFEDVPQTKTERIEFNNGTVSINPPLLPDEEFTYTVTSGFITSNDQKGGFSWPVKIPTDEVVFVIEKGSNQVTLKAEYLTDGQSPGQGKLIEDFSSGSLVLFRYFKPELKSEFVVIWEASQNEAEVVV